MARRRVKTQLPPARGYFAIGVEGISKAVNLGNLLRSAHAFGASFVFTIGADDRALVHTDTAKSSTHLPLYHWRSLAELKLPKGCSLVGVELLDEAHDLPSFPHPLRAAYVLGPERGALSPDLARHCQHLVRIPTPPSMSPPPGPSSCTTDCARLGVLARGRLRSTPSACRPRRTCRARPESAAGRGCRKGKIEA